VSELPHFPLLLQLLRQEKEADYRTYLETVRENPLSERVKQGYTWYPLQVINTGFALGEKAFVVLERGTRLNEPHQLRAGQMVSLFCQATGAEEPEKQGVINYVERNRMKIILNSRDVPDWINMGQIGVDMLFDDRSYLEMERALEKVMNAKGDRLAEIRNLLTQQPGAGKYSPHQPDPAGNDSSQKYSWLNPSQQAAVSAIIQNRDVTIIHGPPGTGKTTTVVTAIQALAQSENTILVTAPSNTAADLLTERLANAGISVVRIGNISRVDESVLQHTLDALMNAHPESKNIKKVKIEAAEYRRQSRRYKRSFRAEDRTERLHLKQQARELESWAKALEDRLVEEILSSAQAITCTLVGAAHPLLEKRSFRTCIIDEAAQALEPACWIPMAKCSRVVLAGDPFQLPPTVKDLDAARKGLAHTLIERCLSILPDRVHLLTVQYRMHQAIMGFSNDYFYSGALEADTRAANRMLHLPHATDAEPSITFVDTAGCGFDEKLQESNGRLHKNLSRYNLEEALLVREHLIQLLRSYPQDSGHFEPPSIGILSPYREQVTQLDTIIREDAELSPWMGAGYIQVSTIDGFQGQERDVIYISLVRSNNKNEIGFLQDYRRMNVAMTRARMMLVVIGDSATIGSNKFYASFLDYCAANGAYKTAWEYMRS
jgi:ATP-dependent RNA/DNA helicase IGHMBP2